MKGIIYVMVVIMYNKMCFMHIKSIVTAMELVTSIFKIKY